MPHFKGTQPHATTGYVRTYRVHYGPHDDGKPGSVVTRDVPWSNRVMTFQRLFAVLPKQDDPAVQPVITQQVQQRIHEIDFERDEC